jgi:hypothetical protein
MTSRVRARHHGYVASQAEAPSCARCGREVRVSREQYETFERMHYVCFHYEFEHDPFDPDEECAAGGCPSSRLDGPPPALGDATT